MEKDKFRQLSIFDFKFKIKFFNNDNILSFFFILKNKMTSAASIVKKLLKETKERNRSDIIQACEEIIIDRIKEAIDIKEFPQLPVKNILSILSHVNFTDNIDTLKNAIQNVVEFHKDESETLQLLHILKRSNLPSLSFDDCISIFECFTNSDLCNILRENKKLPDVDWEYICEEKNKRIEELQVKINKIKQTKTKFSPIQIKPVNMAKDIHSAASSGDLYSVQWFVEKKGVDVNVKNYCSESFHLNQPNNMTPLICACSESSSHPNESLSVVEYILEKGADVNVKDSHGRTALRCNSIVEIAKLLVKHGADLEAFDNKGYTPLMYHSIKGNVDMVKYLLSAGANNRDNEGRTALHIASTVDVAKFLVENGADIEAVNNNGETPLIYQSFCGNDEVVNYLLSVGANKNAKNNQGKTARDLKGKNPSSLFLERFFLI